MNRRETAADIRAMVEHNQKHGNVTKKFTGVFGGYCAEGSARALGMSGRRRRNISIAAATLGGKYGPDVGDGLTLPLDHIGINDVYGGNNGRESHKILLGVAAKLDGGKGVRQQQREQAEKEAKKKAKETESRRARQHPGGGPNFGARPLAMLLGVLALVGVLAVIGPWLALAALVVAALFVARVLWVVGTEAVNWSYLPYWIKAQKARRRAVEAARAQEAARLGLDAQGHAQAIALGPGPAAEVPELSQADIEAGLRKAQMLHGMGFPRPERRVR